MSNILGGTKHRRRKLYRKKNKTRGGSFLSKIIVPGALLIGQKTMHHRSKRGEKRTRRRRGRRGTRR